jgi:CRISPR/Cas system endoribonuclease Cas6 (RAMP superfamily)
MGNWYEKMSHVDSCTYTFNDHKPKKYVFSHLVLASKFTMLPIAHKVKGSFATSALNIDVSNIILNTLQEDRLFNQ